MYSIRNPETKDELQMRDALLQSTLRQPHDPFAITDEYPIVLHPTYVSHSYCMFLGHTPVAHLNYWPHTLIDSSTLQTVKVALIGNVACHSEHRGQGLVRRLFEHMDALAQSQQIRYSLLWSDLIQFYQKLGYASAGCEFRYTLHNNGEKLEGFRYHRYQPNVLKSNDLQNLLSLRPNLLATLRRSGDEFATLLTIPDTHLFYMENMRAYLVIGKGADMQGVIHEWGAKHACDLIGLINSVMNDFSLDELILLSPPRLPASFTAALTERSTECREHIMALVKKHTPDAAPVSDQCFIWGLDSI